MKTSLLSATFSNIDKYVLKKSISTTPVSKNLCIHVSSDNCEV